NVEGCRFGGRRWGGGTPRSNGNGASELGFGTGEVPCTGGLVNEDRPAGGADQPGNRDPTAVRAETVAALAAAHRVVIAATVELRTTFAEAEQRSIAGEEGEAAGRGIDLELLDSFDGEGERIG